MNFQLLEVMRINAILQALQDVRALPQPLLFRQRTPIVNAVDAEVLARFIGRVQIADLVADDQAAVTYSSGKLQFETTAIPNLKHGVHMTQAMLNMLQSINANGGIQNDQVGMFADYENRTIANLLLGIDQRMEALIVAMHLDAFTYNRLGIQITGATWGMPSDLKITPSITWDTPATATPVTDILTAKRYAAVRYGERYNRMIMSTQAFIYMTATTEFQNKARFVLPPGQPTSILPLQGTAYMKNLAMNVLELDELDIYDARYWTQNADGTLSSAPFMPITNVLLESSDNDNDPNAFDFANAVTTESLVSSLAPANMIGRFQGQAFGPIAYATVPTDLNPPNVTYWGVARGFPRKKRLSANAVLTVGAFSDTIPTTDPFGP